MNQIEQDLIAAARDNQIDRVRELINLRPNIDATNKYGDTALMSAVRRNNTIIVSELIKLRPNPNVTNQFGLTALIMAADYGHIEVVRELIKLRPNPNITNLYGNTALIVAAYFGRLEIVHELIKLRPDPHVTNDEGDTAQTLAACEGHTQIVDLIKVYKHERNAGTKATAILEAGKFKRVDATIEAEKLKHERDAVTEEANKLKREDAVLKSNINLVLDRFKANTTGFANPKDKSFKDNQIINVTLDDVVRQFENTSLSALNPVFQHLSAVAAGHAQQRVLAELNGREISWKKHDMHRQYVQPAVDSAVEEMALAQKRADRLGEPYGLHIIVGRGNGSVDNIPKIKNAFLKYLHDNSIQWSYSDPKNDGFVSIIFKPNKPECADLLS